MNDDPIVYKKLEPILIACLEARIDTRDQIPPLLDRLRAACGEAICDDAMVIFHGGAVKDGYLIEAAFPVTDAVEDGEVHTRMLEAAPALTTLHHGAHQSIRESVLKVYGYLEKHAGTTSLVRREVYRVLNSAHPEENITEVQVILHEWDRLLGEGAGKILGAEARRRLMEGIESISPASSFGDYAAWIQGAMERLDALSDDGEAKCQVVSHCAHVFPQARIDHLRAVYHQRGEVDDILHEMYTDDFWYERPVRRGNVLYMRKNPFDLEGFRKAATPAERRKAYCHCPFVRPYLDAVPAKLSPTLCYCGSGWYRRLWEGVLERPVRLEQVETLLRGNDECRFTITLPLELTGECSPGDEEY